MLRGDAHFSDSQEVDSGTAMIDVARKRGFSLVTIHRWKSKYAGMTSGQKYLRSDNGPEFVSKVGCQWLKEAGCSSLFIKPGSP